MGKIIILTGKSASGKDTLQELLIQEFHCRKMILSTDRPMRPGEKEGKEYHFRTKEEFLKLIKTGQFIEHREYHVKNNGKPDVWRYGLEKVNLSRTDKTDYVVILPPPAALIVKKLYPENAVVFYLSADEETRKKRSMIRGGFNGEEWKRREADDIKVFSQENIKKLEAVTLSGKLEPKRNAENIMLFCN